MEGFIITYKPKDSGSRTILHHTLFGRLLYRNYRGRKYSYYVPGFLDNIRFSRLLDGKIFVETLEGINIDILNVFGEIEISPEDREESELSLKTGREYWQGMASEKKLMMRVKRSSKKKNGRKD